MTVTVAEPAEETRSVTDTLKGSVPDAFAGIVTDIVAVVVSPGAVSDWVLRPGRVLHR
jgi:hypothetical protein